MSKYAWILATVALLILAMLPWLVASCTPEPLLPEQLSLERVYYEQTVAAAQEATRAAERLGSSTRQVVPLGTVATTATAEPKPTEFQTITLTSAPSTTVTRTATDTPTAAPTAIVTIISTKEITYTPEATAKVIVIQSGATPVTPQASPSATSVITATVTAYASPSIPSGLVDVQDVITEQMLSEQVAEDAASDTSLSHLVIELTPEGIHSVSRIMILPGVTRSIVTTGIFVVENASLKVKVTSILLERADVTEQYRSRLESSLSWTLYQLLPQRYVESFDAEEGQVTVYSKVRPQP